MAGAEPEAVAAAAAVIARALDGAPADRALKRELRRFQKSGNETRAFVSRAVFGTLSLKGRLAHQLFPHAPDARLLLGLWLVDEERADAETAARLTGTDAAVLERCRKERVRFPDDDVGRIATLRSLPRWLARVLVDERGFDGADALAAGLNARGPVTARANLLKTSRPALASALEREGIGARAGALSPWALHLGGRPNIRASLAWRSGLFEVQDEGSQLIALATGARPGDVVIDLCAGRGGKSLALAAMMHGEGRVLAFDVDSARLRDLETRKRRAGAACIEVVRERAALPRDADVVLVDAPCSEVGALRRGPHNKWLLDEAAVARLPALQLALLVEGAARVRRGGRLVYATCTVLAAENQGVVSRFLDEGARFALDEERELLPHIGGTDGFYLACLTRG